MEGLVNGAISLAAAVGLWWLYFECYLPYRLDKTRQELFKIRDQLFAEWHRAGLSFNTPAYGIMRSTLNGMIRFTHKLSIIRVAVAAETDKMHGGSVANGYQSRFKAALDDVPEDGKAIIERARRQMHEVVAEHLVLSSLFVTALVPIAMAFHIGAKAKKAVSRRWAAAIDAEAQAEAESGCPRDDRCFA